LAPVFVETPHFTQLLPNIIMFPKIFDEIKKVEYFAILKVFQDKKKVFLKVIKEEVKVVKMTVWINLL